MDKTVASRRDIYALLVSLVLLTLLFWTLIDCGLALGAALIWIMAVAATYWYLKDSTVRTNSVASWLCFVGATVFTPIYILGGSYGLLVIVFLWQAVCLLLWMAMITGHGGAHRKLTDLLPASLSVLGYLFSGLFELGEGLGEYSDQRRIEKEQKNAPKRAFPWGIVGGVLLALPVLAILIPILSSADAAFSGMMSSITDSIADFFEHIAERIGSLMIAGLLAVIFFYPVTSLMYSLRKIPGKGEAPAKEILPGTLLVGFYGSICLLCLAYLFSQLSYLFNGFLGVLPENLTAAEYARRGFFEILAFSLLSLGLVGIGLLLAKKDRLSAVSSGLIIFLCVFTLLLIATAFAKMILYMRLYGLSVKRLTVTAILLFLAVLFIVLILGRIFKKFPSLPVVIATAILIFGFMGYTDPCRLVAEYNVAAWQSGQLSDIDVSYLGDLSYGALPALVKVYESDDADASARAEEALVGIYQEICEAEGIVTGSELPLNDRLFSFNYAEYRARQELNDLIRFTDANGQSIK